MAAAARGVIRRRPARRLHFRIHAVGDRLDWLLRANGAIEKACRQNGGEHEGRKSDDCRFLIMISPKNGSDRIVVETHS